MIESDSDSHVAVIVKVVTLALRIAQRNVGSMLIQDIFLCYPRIIVLILRVYYVR